MARQIKRYDNRKLYDTELSTYVSLRDLARLVRRGETVEVVDNVTGEDITAQTLTQVILEEGRKGRSVLSTETLHSVLRRGSEVLDSGLEQVRTGLDDFMHQSARQLAEMAQVPSAEDVERLQRRLDELERVVGRLLEKVQERPPRGEED